MATAPIIPAPAKTGFLAKFEHAFASLFHKAPTWTHVASTVIAFAAPVVEGILAIDAPELIPVVTPIVDRIKAGLATASVLVGEGSASAPTLASTLSAVQSELQNILAETGVKDAATTSKVTANVNLVIGELQAVIGMIPVV